MARQKIMSDVEEINTHIDLRFNEALKGHAQHPAEEEPKTPKTIHAKRH